MKVPLCAASSTDNPHTVVPPHPPPSRKKNPTLFFHFFPLPNHLIEALRWLIGFSLMSCRQLFHFRGEGGGGVIGDDPKWCSNKMLPFFPLFHPKLNPKMSSGEELAPKIAENPQFCPKKLQVLSRKVSKAHSSAPECACNANTAGRWRGQKKGKKAKKRKKVAWKLWWNGEKKVRKMLKWKKCPQKVVEMVKKGDRKVLKRTKMSP